MTVLALNRPTKAAMAQAAQTGLASEADVYRGFDCSQFLVGKSPADHIRLYCGTRSEIMPRAIAPVTRVGQHVSAVMILTQEF
jgi:hypothetical protein